MKKSDLIFHWSLPIDGEKSRASLATKSGIPNFDDMITFTQVAEAMGIESLLMPFGFHMPDPIPLVAALASYTSKIKFLIAYRPGIISPTLFVQQFNTLSHLVKGRMALNMISGTSPKEQAQYGDFLDHDQRIERANEFLIVAKSLWRTTAPFDFDGEYMRVKEAQLKTPYFENGIPKIYISGNSALTEKMALDQGNAWLRYADTPENIRNIFKNSKKNGIATGLRMSIIARQTNEEAFTAAEEMIADPRIEWKKFIGKVIAESDSIAVKSTFNKANSNESQWISPNIWTGAVPFRGGPAVAIVGSYDVVAQRIMDLKDCGVNEFIFSGWTNLCEMKRFGEFVLPKIRNYEKQGVKS